MSDTDNDPRLGLPSASKMERVCACAGSENLIKTIPADKLLAEEKPDDLAERGTRLHKARETGVTLDLDDEETGIYEAGLEYEAKQVAKWKATYGLKDEDVVEGERELRLYMHDPSTMRPVGSGQLDVHFHTRDWRFALVNDWKSGFLTHLTGAVGNWQLRFQGVLLWLEHPELEYCRVSFTKALFKKSKLDYADYSQMDLKYAWDSLMFHLWESRQEDAKRAAGHWCRWCPARAWCPQAAALAFLPKKLVNQTLIGEDAAKAVQADDVSLATLRFLWEESSVIRAILDAVSDRLKGMTDEELSKVSLKHGEPRVLTPITDTRGAYLFLSKVQGWPDIDIWQALEFSNGKVEEIAKREKGGISKKAAALWRKEAMKDFITPKECEKPIVEDKGE